MIGQFKIHGRLTALKLERTHCYVYTVPCASVQCYEFS